MDKLKEKHLIDLMDSPLVREMREAPGEGEAVNIRMHPALLRRLNERAEREFRTRNSLVVMLLSEAMRGEV